MKILVYSLYSVKLKIPINKYLYPKRENLKANGNTIRNSYMVLYSSVEHSQILIFYVNYLYYFITIVINI